MNDDLRKAFEDFEGFDELLDQLADHDDEACPMKDKGAPIRPGCAICMTILEHDDDLSDAESDLLAKISAVFCVMDMGILLAFLAARDEMLSMIKLVYLVGKHFGKELENGKV